MAVISIPLTNLAATPVPGGMATMRPNLFDLDLKGCEELVTALGHKAFNGRNLFKWIHKHGVLDFEAMTDLSLGLRTQLHDTTEIRPPRLAEEWPSADGTRKWMMELADGQRVETVLIPLLIPQERRNTLCVSSQVGCALNCSFCATARQGFNRNLTPGEIIGQVWHATRWLGVPPSNVVLMGMGEPLANFDNLVTALSIMQDDLAYMAAKQRVTVSTSGIVPNIYRLAEVSDVSLAVSLHAPNDALRDELVPINKKYPLEVLIPACRNYIGDERRRRVTWEYVMLDGVNDSPTHAKQLIRLLEGTRSKVNLIPFNPFPGSDYRTSPIERIDAFRDRLIRSGLFTTTRKTRGDEISAACGQLVGRVRDRGRRGQAPQGWPLPVVAT